MAKRHIPAHMAFNGTIPDVVNLSGMEVAAESEMDAWRRLRLGKITASKFSVVKQNKTGDWGETASTYLYELISEHLTGQPADMFSNNATEWGNGYEAEAIKIYAETRSLAVQKGRFLKVEGLILVGGTPDGLVDWDGVIEVKCPYTPKNHLRTLIEKRVPTEYVDQVDGHLLVTGREWCDFISYDPRIPNQELRLVVIRVHRDESRISALKERLESFEALLISHLNALGIEVNADFQRVEIPGK